MGIKIKSKTVDFVSYYLMDDKGLLGVYPNKKSANQGKKLYQLLSKDKTTKLIKSEGMFVLLDNGMTTYLDLRYYDAFLNTTITKHDK